MSIAENKAIFRRFVDEVMNQGKIAAIDELTAPDLVEHKQLPPGVPTNREGVKLLFSMYHTDVISKRALMSGDAQRDSVPGRCGKEHDDAAASRAPFLNNTEFFSRAIWEHAPSSPTLGLLSWLL
jgi:hypothetical protein